MLLTTFLSALPLLSPALPQEPVQNNKPCCTSCTSQQGQNATAKKAQKAKNSNKQFARSNNNGNQAKNNARKNGERKQIVVRSNRPNAAKKQEPVKSLQFTPFAQGNANNEPTQNGVWGLADVKVRKRDRVKGGVQAPNKPVAAGNANSALSVNKLGFVKTGVNADRSRNTVWSNKVSGLNNVGIGATDVSGLAGATGITVVQWGGNTEAANQSSPIGGLAAVNTKQNKTKAKNAKSKKNKAKNNAKKKTQKAKKAKNNKAKQQRQNGQKRR